MSSRLSLRELHNLLYARVTRELEVVVLWKSLVLTLTSCECHIDGCNAGLNLQGTVQAALEIDVPGPTRNLAQQSQR